ncbi:MAG TPA: glyoxalase, partial [Chloroflexi bacterium]|nr:glyoxalase [Chloroflexota bacterium]
TNDWDRLRYKLESKEIKFIIQPNVRFENSPGEQKTMFISDPSGNVLEFKCFQNDDMIFKS